MVRLAAMSVSAQNSCFFVLCVFAFSTAVWKTAALAGRVLFETRKQATHTHTHALLSPSSPLLVDRATRSRKESERSVHDDGDSTSCRTAGPGVVESSAWGDVLERRRLLRGGHFCDRQQQRVFLGRPRACHHDGHRVFPHRCHHQGQHGERCEELGSEWQGPGEREGFRKSAPGCTDGTLPGDAVNISSGFKPERFVSLLSGREV